MTVFEVIYREKIAAMMLDLGLATGHGDTTDDLLSELRHQVAEKDVWINELETSNPAWELLISTQNEVVKWKKEVIKWQDTDTKNQEAIEALREDKDVEIAALKKGFIDVDDALKKDVRISQLEQAIKNTLDTGMTRYIYEAINEATEEQ